MTEYNFEHDTSALEASVAVGFLIILGRIRVQVAICVIRFFVLGFRKVHIENIWTKNDTGTQHVYTFFLSPFFK